MEQERVQSFWFGDKLSPYEIMCIKSFLAPEPVYDLGHTNLLPAYRLAYRKSGPDSIGRQGAEISN
jgi:hypothetical protein